MLKIKMETPDNIINSNLPTTKNHEHFLEVGNLARTTETIGDLNYRNQSNQSIKSNQIIFRKHWSSQQVIGLNHASTWPVPARNRAS
jgi:hypothetical protein